MGGGQGYPISGLGGGYPISGLGGGTPSQVWDTGLDGGRVPLTRSDGGGYMGYPPTRTGWGTPPIH